MVYEGNATNQILEQALFYNPKKSVEEYGMPEGSIEQEITYSITDSSITSVVKDLSSNTGIEKALEK
ncbi:hypothetical protein C0585_07075 [Candidatus Woesearchaeota archaeon]|nr:MAG: hypothetical protein C0585_07075 [Candidatus Woesearchaeota archaeon]